MYAGCNTTRYGLNTISKPSAYEISLCLLDIDQQPTHSLGVETSRVFSCEDITHKRDHCGTSPACQGPSGRS